MCYTCCSGGLSPSSSYDLIIYRAFMICISYLISYSRVQEIWSLLGFPLVDTLPSSTPDATFREGGVPKEEWPHLLSPLLYMFGAALAYWGATLLRLLIRLISLILAPLHRCAILKYPCGLPFDLSTVFFLSIVFFFNTCKFMNNIVYE